jgi:hypothetical protein
MAHSSAHLEVLSHEPGLERRKQQRGRHAAEDAANEQHVEVVEVLGEAAKHITGNIGQCSLLPAPASRRIQLGPSMLEARAVCVEV